MNDIPESPSHPADQVPRIIRVALIEDNRLVREGIATLLEQIPDFQVVMKASSADTSVLKEVSPMVILLDLGLRDGSSLRVVRTINMECPDSRVIVLDLLPVQEDIVEFVHAGVSGFIMKDATLDDLVETIRSVAQGNDVLPPEMTGALFSEIAREAVAKGRRQDLGSVRMTSRERDVVLLIAEGASNKAIAKKVHISPHTVKSHVRNIMEKLELHTRLQIAAYAHRSLGSEPEPSS